MGHHMIFLPFGTEIGLKTLDLPTSHKGHVYCTMLYNVLHNVDTRGFSISSNSITSLCWKHSNPCHLAFQEHIFHYHYP